MPKSKEKIFIVTTTDPKSLRTDEDDYEDRLENCMMAMNDSAAETYFNSLKRRTNCDVYMLEVRIITKGRGTLLDKK